MERSLTGLQISGIVNVCSGVRVAKNQCWHILYQLRDIKDCDAIYEGNFSSIAESFNLTEAVNELYDILLPQCAMKNIYLVI
jgi:hypothetical protein